MQIQSQSPPITGSLPDVAVQKLGKVSIGIGSILSKNSTRLDHPVSRIERLEKAQSQAKRLLD
jgi:hypothetical protein